MIKIVPYAGNPFELSAISGNVFKASLNHQPIFEEKKKP